jgi:PLAC8 family
VFDIAVVPSIKVDGKPYPCGECGCTRPNAASDDVENPKTDAQHTAAAAATGEWKDGVLDLFRYGVMHPTVWNALCCPQVLMKQLSNRLSGPDGSANDEGTKCLAASAKESSVGGDGGAQSPAAGYKRGTTLFLAACVVDFLLIAPILEATTAVTRSSDNGQQQPGGGASSASAAVSIGTQCFYVLWTLALTSIAIYSVVQLRAAVRARHGIASGGTTKCCGGTGSGAAEAACEDVCCVVCCHSCTLAQLARQTADYDEEEAHCCTVDGLAGSKRLNPCLFL